MGEGHLINPPSAVRKDGGGFFNLQIEEFFNVRKISKKEVYAIKPDNEGNILCPQGWYNSDSEIFARKGSREKIVFPDGCFFSAGMIFPPFTKFGSLCSFGDGCKFGLDANYSFCKFKDGCTFGHRCEFGVACEFGAACKFENDCNFWLGCCLGRDNHLGDSCTVGEQSSLEDGFVAGANTSIGKSSFILGSLKVQSLRSTARWRRFSLNIQVDESVTLLREKERVAMIVREAGTGEIVLMYCSGEKGFTTFYLTKEQLIKACEDIRLDVWRLYAGLGRFKQRSFA